MFVLNHLTTTRLLLVVVMLIARQAICDNKLNQTNHVSITTAPPKSTPAIVEVKQHPNVVNHQLGSSLPAASATTAPPIVKIDAKAVPVVTKVAPTTPIAHAPSSVPTQATKASTGTINTPVANVTIPAAATHRTPGQWLLEYFEPICNHLDKLLPEHIFKVQSQLKQFVEKTAGKMSVCFMQHFMIDPNLKAVEKAQLGTICSSEHLPTNVNGSFRGFQACAEHNWDKSLDQEFERIIRLRLNCFFNHTHSKNDSTISLVHDNDDISLIGEVVNKVLNTSSKSGPIGKANITMINVGSSPSSTKAPATVAATGGHANKTVGPQTTPAANLKSPANKNILNDPNTLLVFVDDATTKAPAKALQAPTPTQASAATHAVSGAHDKVSVAPAVKTTVAPALAVLVTTLKPASKVLVNSNGTRLVLKNGTHAAEPVVKVAAIAATTAKPLATVLGEKILSAASTSAPVLPVKIVTTQPTTSSKPLVVVATSTVKPAVIPVAASTSSPAATATVAAAAATAKSQPITVVVSTAAPTNAAKVVANSTTVAKIVTNATTTSRPATLAITSVKPLSSTKQPQAASTKAPSTKPSAATQQPQSASTMAPSAVKPSTTGKPVGVGEAASKKSDSDKHQPDSKVKDDEKKTAQLKKEQDENDAKNAIKALQKQRAGHVADARMHQIEHERQMTIDPVGHTLKHQKYEQMKQQKTSTTPVPSANKS